MAISLAKVDQKQNIHGDNTSFHYKATLTGTYPSGGYVIDKTTLPSATAVFSKIYRAYFNGGCMDENGNIYRMDPDDYDNTDPTDPTVTLKAYEMITGGAGYTEIPVGQAHTGNISIIIEGIRLNGVDSDPW